VLAAIACGHEAPFGAPVIDANPGADLPPPRRLTWNAESEWFPAWLPDGSAIGYSYFVPERDDRDRCLGLLRPEIGRLSRLICVRTGTEGDSVNTVLAHAVSAGGRLAIMGESGNPRHLAPAWRWVAIGDLANGVVHRAIRFPYTDSVTQLVHMAAHHLTWLGDTVLAYLAMAYRYKPGTVAVPSDTMYTGIEIVVARVEGDAVVSRRTLPGTFNASSVTAADGRLYLTFCGSSTVYAWDPAAQAPVPVYDFGPGAIARDVQVAAGRLVAVVGGSVVCEFDPFFWPLLQTDSGGPVLAVTLPGGPAVPVTAPGDLRYRHLALHPSGTLLVAEAYRQGSAVSDLWLLEVP
jgi:hypothetical protein